MFISFYLKFFSNQLKEVLLSIISLFQGAFVGDNQIWMVSSWLMSSLTVGSEHGKGCGFEDRYEKKLMIM